MQLNKLEPNISKVENATKKTTIKQYKLTCPKPEPGTKTIPVALSSCRQ